VRAPHQIRISLGHEEQLREAARKINARYKANLDPAHILDLFFGEVFETWLKEKLERPAAHESDLLQ